MCVHTQIHKAKTPSRFPEAVLGPIELCAHFLALGPGSPSYDRLKFLSLGTCQQELTSVFLPQASTCGHLPGDDSDRASPHPASS